jgi:hypothetical protein
MHRLLTATIVAGALLLAPTAASATAEPIATISCTSAKIQGKSKCIARGQYCVHSKAAERDYNRYGLSCSKRDARGSWHLQ